MCINAVPWSGRDYRVLAECLDVEEIARRLGRDLREVRSRAETTFEDWYRRRRCPDSPEQPDAIVAIAHRIYFEDGYEEYIDVGDLENIVLGVAEAAFRTFHADRMDAQVNQGPELSPPARFVCYFAVCLRRRLRAIKERAKLRQKRQRSLAERPSPDPDAGSASRRDEGLAWSRLLFAKGLARLPAEARRYVLCRYLEGLEVSEIATRLKRSTRTLYNNYSEPKVISMIQKEVNAMMLNLPTERLRAIILYLHVEADFPPKIIAEMLCLPRSLVEQHLDGAIDGMMGKLWGNGRREEVMALLDG